MKKVFLIGMILIGMAGCGGTSAPNVTGTKDDPSIQAVKALFSTKAATSSVKVNDIDQTQPFLLNLLLSMGGTPSEQNGTDQYGYASIFPCNSGTRGIQESGYDNHISTYTFNNCEYVVAELTLLADSAPSCIKKVTIDGTIVSEYRNTIQTGDGTSTYSITNTPTITFTKSDDTTTSISCAFNITATMGGNEFVTTGTICGVDMATVNSVCSL